MKFFDGIGLCFVALLGVKKDEVVGDFQKVANK